MSYSSMKSGVDAISAALVGQRAVLSKVKTNAQGASDALGSIPTEYAAVVAEIQAIPDNTTNPAEALLKAELIKLTNEFIALRAVADSVAGIDLGA